MSHPGLETQLVAAPRSVDLSKREADIAITTSQPSHGRLHSKKLTSFELGLYGTQDYLVNASTIENIEDLSSHRLIGYISELIFTPEMNYLPNLNSDVKIAFGATNVFCQFEAVKADAGLAVLPCWLAWEDPKLRSARSEERRAGKAVASTCKSRGPPIT